MIVVKMADMRNGFETTDLQLYYVKFSDLVMAKLQLSQHIKENNWGFLEAVEHKK